MDAAPATLPRRFCGHHARRPAIAVCVITGTPVCGECSTRYEGVNYSREGLRLLRERRAAEAAGRRSWLGTLGTWLVVCSTPLLLWAVYLSYTQTATLLIDLLHGDLMSRGHGR